MRLRWNNPKHTSEMLIELFEKRGDRALLLASHSSGVIREFCDQAMVIHDGLGTLYNDVGEALEIYDSL